ncbi:MAG TPA: Lrp/AsnC family transcriptional regulator, partial [Casimicrobiaceae bacterium]|nr:Lrp/AsnC family transcriptional regulator [Casimicrobiaceae bacterium]
MLDEFDRRLIVATQGGLPLVSRPYDALAEQLGCT